MPLSDGELYDIFKTLGEFKGTIAALVKVVDEDRHYASRQRNENRELLAALAEANRVANAQREQWQEEWSTEWRPLIEAFRERMQQEEGRRQIGRIVAAFWLTVSGGIIAVFTLVAQHFWNVKP